MGSKFDDDELFIAESAVPSLDGNLGSGDIALYISHKEEAPLEATDYQVTLDLMGVETGDERHGVDIVTILDVSESMSGKKLEKLKACVKYLVTKLSPIDRLSIVTFSSEPQRLCPLIGIQKNEEAKANIETLIDKLRTSSGTNITGGLQIALRILDERRLQEGRTSVIILMSDGYQSTEYDHPSIAPVGDVPIYIFGLGNDHNSQVLQGIASRSNRGTYSTISIADIEDSDSASINVAFSSCVSEVLSIRMLVQDLKLKVTQIESEFHEVHAGNYDLARVNESVTVSFGNLYSNEKHKTTVLLILPSVQVRTASDVLKFNYTYRPRGGGNLYKSAPIFLAVTRTSSPVIIEPIEVEFEVARGDIAARIEPARKLAESNDFDGARKTFNSAEKSVFDLPREEDELITALKYEVQEFLRLLEDPETYTREGRPFALSFELCRNLQQFATRCNTTQLLAVACPLSVQFGNQAVKFDQDINFEVPTADEDKKEVAKIFKESYEIAKKEKKELIDEQITALMDKVVEEDTTTKATDKNNPIVTQADTLKHDLGQAIETLKAIQDLIAALQST
ncbi:E3 ubiquitin-protein ligase WAV3-like [Silene latifolia]|uniref:E3 ubiquitin-protein ligase WAV3-like n=1 Tax=Silene latifolia TaxID=37657 RepID=UPI003D781C37